MTADRGRILLDLNTSLNITKRTTAPSGLCRTESYYAVGVDYIIAKQFWMDFVSGSTV